LDKSTIWILVVDDYQPWRRFVSATLQSQSKLQVISEASDGLAAVQKAQELQPDLILLDIGLPTLNGIEVARQIRKLSPESKILFVSQESSADVVQEALSTGARGYVVKSDVGRELLTAVDTVLRGEYFIDKSFAGNDFVEGSDEVASQEFRTKSASVSLQRNTEIARRHEVGFYSDDRLFLHSVTQFLGTALKAGNAAIVVATESHRNGLLPRLKAHGVDIAAAIEHGRYVSQDAADALSTFIVNGKPDAALFLNYFGNLIAAAADAAQGEQSRVAVFGEGVHLLLARGNAEAAIRVERLTNKIARTYDVDILCGYSLGIVQGEMFSHIFQRICAEHSAVNSQ